MTVAPPPRDIIQSLWIGTRLSMMEQLSIHSFLTQGHPFHLYVAGPVAGIPAGAVVRDAREILPETPILRYRSGFGAGSPSLYSNLFRFALLHQHGGWWVDLDVVALRPFPSAANPVLGLVRSRHGPSRAGSAVQGLPAKSEFTARCLEILRVHDPASARWGELGPGLVNQVARELAMERFMRPPATFFPVEAGRFWDLIRPGPLWPEATGVHLWQNLWRHYGVDPDRRYPKDSPYEQLLTRYHPEAGAPRRPVNVPLLLLRSVPRRVGLALTARRRRRQRATE